MPSFLRRLRARRRAPRLVRGAGKQEAVDPAEIAGDLSAAAPLRCGRSPRPGFDRRASRLLAAQPDDASKPSSEIGTRCAVVRAVMPMPIGPRSSTTTSWPRRKLVGGRQSGDAGAHHDGIGGFTRAQGGGFRDRRIHPDRDGLAPRPVLDVPIARWSFEGSSACAAPDSACFAAESLGVARASGPADSHSLSLGAPGPRGVVSPLSSLSRSHRSSETALAQAELRPPSVCGDAVTRDFIVAPPPAPPRAAGRASRGLAAPP